MELLEQIETYLVRTGTSASTFGRAVVADPRFVQDLRDGRQPRRRTKQKVSDFLSAAEGCALPNSDMPHETSQ
jgi:2,4-dienoyl-CoA reductase-like NADH-dependent reductase (Old Yellow Enzyme family)